jgi:hypothetical protein
MPIFVVIMLGAIIAAIALLARVNKNARKELDDLIRRRREEIQRRAGKVYWE